MELLGPETGTLDTVAVGWTTLVATLLIIATAPGGRMPTPAAEAAADPAEEAAAAADVTDPAATEAEEEDDATLSTSARMKL